MDGFVLSVMFSLLEFGFDERAREHQDKNREFCKIGLVLFLGVRIMAL